MKGVALSVVAAIGAAVLASSAGAATGGLKGTVVGKVRGLVLVAPANGFVQAVRGHASIGSRVTFASGRLVVVGRSHVALVRGIVVRRIGTTLFLSSNRHLVAVHTGRSLAAAADTTPTTPATGDDVEEQVTVGANGQLDEDNEDDLGAAGSSSVQVQAVVLAVGAGTVTLTVNGQSLTVPLPAGLTLPSSIVGQTVTLNLSLDDQSGDQSDDQGDDEGGD